MHIHLLVSFFVTKAWVRVKSISAKGDEKVGDKCAVGRINIREGNSLIEKNN